MEDTHECEMPDCSSTIQLGYRTITHDTDQAVCDSCLDTYFKCVSVDDDETSQWILKGE